MANNKVTVTFYKIPRSELATFPIKEGQLIFTTDTGKLYLDETNTSRIQIDGKDFTYGLSIDGNTVSIEKNNGNASISLPTYTAADVGAIALTEKGTNSGVAELDNSGKVPSSQLPSYVDDVLEYASLSQFPQVGESGKIYIALDTDKTYRWGGSTYIVIASDLALGETSATAYRGDRGKAAYDHSQSIHAPVDAEKNTIETIKVNNTALTPDANRAVNITINTNSIHIVDTNNSSTPFILLDAEPGIYIFPSQKVYVKAKAINQEVATLDTLDRTVIITGIKTSEASSLSSVLGVFIDKKGFGYRLTYYNDSATAGFTLGYDSNNIVTLSSSQTFSGKKTFSILPESSVTPTTDNQLTNKKYVDDAIASNLYFTIS